MARRESADGIMKAKPRCVWVIEWLNFKKKWEVWEIHGTGEPTVSEGGGLPFYRKRTRDCHDRWPEHKFRLVRYLPEK